MDLAQVSTVHGLRYAISDLKNHMLEKIVWGCIVIGATVFASKYVCIGFKGSLMKFKVL